MLQNKGVVQVPTSSCHRLFAFGKVLACVSVLACDSVLACVSLLACVSVLVNLDVCTTVAVHLMIVLNCAALQGVDLS